MTTADRVSSDTVRALDEVAAPVTSVPETELEAVVDELLAARRIACYAGERGESSENMRSRHTNLE